MKRIKRLLTVILSSSYIMTQATNPFLIKPATPFETVPFDKIKIEHYEPAFDEAMKLHNIEIDAIVNNHQAPTFANTIEALEHSGHILNLVSSVFFNLNSAESNDQMMDLSQKISPKLTEHSNNITLNEKLFDRVKAVYDQRDKLGLNPEQKMLLERTYISFEKNGANLKGEDKEKFRKLSTDLAQATLMFGQNVLKETNKYLLELTDKSELAGLPADVIDAAALRAKDKKKTGWAFDLSMPSYVAFMKYSDRRDLREKLYMAYNSKCMNGGEFDNRELIKKISQLRMEIAQLMGYKNYAEYALRDRMAKNENNVYDLLNKLLDAYKPVALEEYKELQGYAIGHENKDITLMPWDFSYYAEKLKDAKFQINDELLRPYFELENVKKGVFGLATELYGLTFKKNEKIPVYNPEVEAFEVYDVHKKFIAILYTDFHPRSGKRNGAWMTEYKGQYKLNGKDNRPSISLVMNFTRPTASKPALLTYDEVNTFLHEFGHSLHGMLTQCTYESLSGTNVYRDFVELPSQFMENYMSQKEFLDRFAVHYQTGEKIPAELVKKIKEADNFNVAYATVRQLNFGFLDMAWHTLTSSFGGDPLVFESEACSKTQILPKVDGVSISTAFNHIFAGGYAAGYYSYKWAEVLDADAFSLFEQKGIFSKEAADSFRKNILEKGGTEDPMVLYKKFRGQEPTIDALLKRTGI
ncbi:M3 family metallopeptidase [Parabacteroides sp. FAFU027]|uniref:M3 family metallopeptidase n=1 Tax=Parabacteroides sp. FAFU027 TaxID=2922715 RepID=UPI001FB035EF|nr:M3 family metallopeptidase [Parabacteroides sp. FAFU027]